MNFGGGNSWGYEAPRDRSRSRSPIQYNKNESKDYGDSNSPFIQRFQDNSRDELSTYVRDLRRSVASREDFIRSQSTQMYSRNREPNVNMYNNPMQSTPMYNRNRDPNVNMYNNPMQGNQMGNRNFNRNQNNRGGGNTNTTANNRRQNNMNRNQNSNVNRNLSVASNPPISNTSMDRLTQFMSDFASSRTNNAVTPNSDMIPVFDPADVSITCEAWCRKVDSLVALANLTDEMTMTYVTTKLRGSADVWFKNKPYVKSNWLEFKRMLQEEFPCKRNYFKMLTKMINRKKKVNESYITYFHEKMTLLTDLKITGEDAVSCVLGGISEATRNAACEAKLTSPEAVLGYLTAMESVAVRKPETEKVQFSNQRNESRANLSFSESLGAPSNNATRPKCVLCIRRGHVAKDCQRTCHKKNHQINDGCTECHKETHIDGCLASITSPQPNNSNVKKPKNLVNIQCFKCGNFGHYSRSCQIVTEILPACIKCGINNHKVDFCDLALAKMFGCVKCGEKNHKVENCERLVEIKETTCTNCNVKGHLAKACRKNRPCSYCAQTGHLDRQCPNKNSLVAQQSAVKNTVGSSNYDSINLEDSPTSNLRSNEGNNELNDSYTDAMETAKSCVENEELVGNNGNTVDFEGHGDFVVVSEAD